MRSSKLYTACSRIVPFDKVLQFRLQRLPHHTVHVLLAAGLNICRVEIRSTASDIGWRCLLLCVCCKMRFVALQSLHVTDRRHMPCAASSLLAAAVAAAPLRSLRIATHPPSDKTLRSVRLSSPSIVEMLLLNSERSCSLVSLSRSSTADILLKDRSSHVRLVCSKHTGSPANAGRSRILWIYAVN